MGKVNLLVKYCLRNANNEYNIKGIFTNDSKLKFKLENSKMLLDKKNLILERDTNDLKLIFDFNNNKCNIHEKSSHINLVLDINILELVNKDNYFKVRYKIEEDEYQISIEIKDID